MDLSTIRMQHKLFKSLQAFISSLSVAPRPLFPCYWPTPTRGFFTLFVDIPPSTSNRIDEYVQRSMNRDYPRVACNDLGNISVSLLNLCNQYLEWEGEKGPSPHLLSKRASVPFTRFSGEYSVTKWGPLT